MSLQEGERFTDKRDGRGYISTQASKESMLSYVTVNSNVRFTFALANLSKATARFLRGRLDSRNSSKDEVCTLAAWPLEPAVQTSRASV